VIVAGWRPAVLVVGLLVQGPGAGSGGGGHGPGEKARLGAVPSPRRVGIQPAMEHMGGAGVVMAGGHAGKFRWLGRAVAPTGCPSPLLVRLGA